VVAAGTATLVSWVVTHSRSAPRNEDANTATIGLVELTEGPWMYGRLLDITTTALHEGTSLLVDFVRPGGGEPVPVFRPA
jgi:hypothetical protein